MDFLIRKTLGVHGDIMEFGCRWEYLIPLYSLHLEVSMNHLIDTKKLLPLILSLVFKLHKKDGNHDISDKNALYTHSNYEKYLEKILIEQEKIKSFKPIKKFEIIKGDAVKTFEIFK